MRTDVGNAYNSARHREMWAVLHNPEAPILAALQMDAAAVVVNLYMIPDEPGIFRQCVENIGRLRHACDQYAMPLMIEPLVMSPAGGRRLRLARRRGEDRAAGAAGARAGRRHHQGRPDRTGGRLPPRGGSGALPDAGARRRQGELGPVLEKSAALMACGASGMVYGRNVYQHSNPSQVVRALMAIIHQGASGQQALEIYHQQ